MTFEDLRVFVDGCRRAELLEGRPEAPPDPAGRQPGDPPAREGLGERLFDRSSRDGTLTDAGQLLLEYATRLLRLADEASGAVRELREVRKGRVLIGANEAACTRCCRSSTRSTARTRASSSTSGALPSRQMAQEVLLRTLDFGVLTFSAARPRPAVARARHRRAGPARAARRIRWRAAATSRWRRWAARPSSRTTIRRRRASACCACYEQRHAPLNIQHVAAEPRRHQARGRDGAGRRAAAATLRAQDEIARGQLVEVQVPELRSPRQVRFVFRRDGELSHAARGVSRRRARDDSGATTSERRARSRTITRDVGQARRRAALDLLVPRRAGARSRPSCRRDQRVTRRARAADSDGDRASGRHAADRRRDRPTNLRRRIGGRASASRAAVSIDSGACAVTHGRPSISELPKKISANDSPTTARIPQRPIACGACSRDDPQPKFAPTSRTRA